MAGLKFIEGGPTLPFELITAQEEGRVVFLCGAGVSMGPPIWLPNFNKLVAQIYEELGEDWSLHPGEAEGMDCDDDYKAPDRTLNALAKRLKGQRSRIDEALKKALSKGHKGTGFHHNLLKLSRGSDGDVRLVTTNFDLVFEKSWRRYSGGPDLPNHAVAGMPGPGAATWRGIFHLHGRLQDADFLNLEPNSLVLTSAEFGDAYLRSGWASRYVYDLLRHVNVVIIGYSLNDPPLRYLSDALDADRERFDFKNLYAIAPIKDGDSAKTHGVWQARGTVPLLYDPLNPKSGKEDHKALRQMIDAWAKYADDPTEWAKKHLARQFRRSFDEIDEQTWSEISWILGRQDSGRVLKEANPTSRWLPKLLARGSGRRSDLEFGPWIAERLDDRDMMDAVLESKAVLSPWACRQIEHKILLKPSDISPTRRAFWFGLIDAAPTDEHGLGEHSYRARRLLRGANDYGYFAKKAISDWFRPRLKLSAKFQPGNRKGRKLQDLASLEFEPEAHLDDVDEVTANWPQKFDRELLDQLSFDLVASLFERAELSPNPLSSVFDLPSVSDSKQNKYRRGFAPLVRLLASLCERMAQHSPSYVRQLANRWKLSGHALERRLWLHCLRLPCFKPVEAHAELLALSDKDFWFVDFEREVMQAIITIWPQLGSKERAALEERLAEGPSDEE